KGIDTFVVPDDIGGRYSVLSAVGLLPIAYAGIDVCALTEGAQAAAEAFGHAAFDRNPAFIYAAARHALMLKGCDIEIMSAFEPRLMYFAEWWKQLFGESQGKDGCGIFPASCMFSTDLHSLGQYIQQGRRDLFETFVMIDGDAPGPEVPSRDDNTDNMNYLAGKSLSWVNSMAYEATAKAHTDGGVPNMTVYIARADAASIGSLIYFYELSCAVSCLLTGVNPFDQPGVEAYKQYMFRLLGKPGYEPMEPDRDSKTVISL
ncbi:MAG: glucose-6-phosphate isomerase, partial [Abditibacteriota bacterium]|nr:glucose-6-phosphate isomerase [Abditibacteriota bacterium]